MTTRSRRNSRYLGWVGLGLLGSFGVAVLVGKAAALGGDDDRDAPATCTPPRTAPRAT